MNKKLRIMVLIGIGIAIIYSVIALWLQMSHFRNYDNSTNSYLFFIIIGGVFLLIYFVIIVVINKKIITLSSDDIASLIAQLILFGALPIILSSVFLPNLLVYNHLYNKKFNADSLFISQFNDKIVISQGEETELILKSNQDYLAKCLAQAGSGNFIITEVTDSEATHIKAPYEIHASGPSRDPYWGKEITEKTATGTRTSGPVNIHGKITFPFYISKVTDAKGFLLMPAVYPKREEGHSLFNNVYGEVQSIPCNLILVTNEINTKYKFFLKERSEINKITGNARVMWIILCSFAFFYIGVLIMIYPKK